MGSRVHFFTAGVAVSALCFLLMAMSWQYVLGLFVLAGVGLGLWSGLAELEKERAVERERRQLSLRKGSAARRRAGMRSFKRDNVFQFPVHDLKVSSLNEAID